MPPPTKRKGLHKRSATRFKSGHPCFKKKAKVEGENVSRDEYLLRKREKTDDATEKNEYFITNVELLEKMWNISFKEHSQSSPKCDGSLTLHKKQQLIISTTWYLNCDSCSYEGKVFKVYTESNMDEKKPGTKPSSLNLALGAALVKSPIGPNVCKEIFLTLGIDCGSSKGLQNAMTASGKKIVDLGNKNLDAEKQHARLVSEAGEGDVGIFDTVFNNPIYGSPAPHTYQPAKQAVTTVVSNNTKKAIEVVTANKHCPKCWNAQRKNETSGDCQSCIADTMHDEAIGDESKYARQAARNLKKANLNLSGICNDRDTTAADSFEDEWGKPLQKFIDPLHLARGQKRACVNASFSDRVLVGKNKTEKGFSQKRLAEEIKQRCTAEMTAAIRYCSDKSKHETNSNTLKSSLTDALTTTPFAICECYKGNHQFCQKSSFVCKPEEGKIWEKSCLLPEMKHSLDMTQADEILLRKMIRLRLGPPAVAKTYKNISTNIVEARNRGYAKTNPKSVLSTTNFKARVMASVLHNNVGTDESCRLIQSAIKHKVSPNIVRKLRIHQQQDVERFKEIKKTAKSKGKRILKKKETYNQHNLTLRQRQKKKNASKNDTSADIPTPVLDPVNSDDEIYPYKRGKTLMKDINPPDQISDESDISVSKPGPSWR